MMKRIFLVFCLLCSMNTLVSGSFRQLTVADGLLNNQVCQLVELPNGQILVGTEGLFSLYNGREFVAQEYNLDSLYQLPTFGHHSYMWQGDSLLWLKDFYWLYLYDTQKRAFRYDYIQYVGHPSVKRFINERGDSLTRAHVVRLNPQRPLLDSLTKGTPLQGQWLNAYCRDRQGGQWFGLQNAGIVYLRPSRQKTTCLTGGIYEGIRCMQPLDDERCLMGTNTGIHIFNIRTRQIMRTLVKGDLGCTDASKDSSGNIWISTKKGLYCYNCNTDTWVCYDMGNVKGLLHHHFRFSLPVDKNRLLVCNLLHHLGYFYPQEGRFELLNDKLPQLQKYRTMSAASFTGSGDSIAICTQNGMFLLNVSNDSIDEFKPLQTVSKFTQKFNCILLDSHGRLWIGTGNGLLLYKDNQLVRLTREDGLSNASIRSVAEDNSGNLWVGTSYGINRITIHESGKMMILPLREDDGVPLSELTERGAVIMPNDQALFACVGGLISFNADNFVTEMPCCPITLMKMDVCGTEIMADTLPLSLTHKENSFDIQFSALNYDNPGQTYYRYRLLGLEDDWRYDRNGTGLVSVHYATLAPGEYTFEAQSAIGNGDWGDSLRKSVVVEPPLWWTWWAKLTYVIFISGCITCLLHLYSRHRKAKLEQEYEEKVNRLFELRSEARRQFAHSVNIEPDKITANKDEETLIERILDAINQNMDNTEYTVDQLAREIGMSRANFYKKMQSMLGITPNEFLRNVRLKHAAHLLAETNYPVNQISLMVGFLTPRYFSQCFKKMFGVLPSEYGGRTSE